MMSPKSLIVVILCPLVIIPLLISPSLSMAACVTGYHASGFRTEGAAQAYREAKLRRDVSGMVDIVISEGVDLRDHLPVIWLMKPRGSVGQVKFLGTPHKLWVIEDMIDCY